MTTDAFGLSPKQLLALTVVQCLVQGLLISLFATFLSARSTRPPSFTAYVIVINLLCAGQTVISVVQAADLLDPAPYRESLVLAYATHTIVIGAGVQTFFVDRCWKIFGKRVLPAIPLVLLSLVGLSAGVLLVVYKAQLTLADLAYQASPQNETLRITFEAALRHTEIAVTVWAFSWFVLELGMTCATVVFLYRVRTGLPAHNGIFCTVWQVLWTSVTPPLILMAIVIIDGYVTPGSATSVSRLVIAVTGKFFALSLMINLVGQGHIREKFERGRQGSLSISPNRPGVVISEAMFAPVIVSLVSPGADHRDSACDTDSTRFGFLNAHLEQESDIEKHDVPVTPPPPAASRPGSQPVRFAT